MYDNRIINPQSKKEFIKSMRPADADCKWIRNNSMWRHVYVHHVETLLRWREEMRKSE